MSETLVIGLDIGGTATRVAVTSLSGEPRGAGRAGGGNPTSHGAEAAVVQLRSALSDALATVDPSRVRAGTIGLAGAGRLIADPAGRAAFAQVWREVGLRCPYTLVGDALVAYASATDALNGTVLIAGTGAIAAEVRGLLLGRIADGHGWLLGDAGSGFWLGREAVRATLADLDRHRDPTPLAQLLLNELLGSPSPTTAPRQTVDALVQVVTRRPPVELAALAPLVIRAYDAGDETARSIITSAAQHLCESVTRIRADEAQTPIVLAGGLLIADTPIAAAVQEILRVRWPHAPLLTAGDGAIGAAWLAARALPDVTDAALLHARLLSRVRP